MKGMPDTSSPTRDNHPVSKRIKSEEIARFEGHEFDLKRSRMHLTDVDTDVESLSLVSTIATSPETIDLVMCEELKSPRVVFVGKAISQRQDSQRQESDFKGKAKSRSRKTTSFRKIKSNRQDRSVDKKAAAVVITNDEHEQQPFLVSDPLSSEVSLAPAPAAAAVVVVEDGTIDSSPQLKAGAIITQIIDSFNIGDIESLSQIVSAHCAENCELLSNALPMPVRGRKYIMMYWALQMETFPDGIWVCTKSQVKGNSITRSFKFSGTRVFTRPTEDLFLLVRHHIQVVVGPHAMCSVDDLSSAVGGCWNRSDHHLDHFLPVGGSGCGGDHWPCPSILGLDNLKTREGGDFSVASEHASQSSEMSIASSSASRLCRGGVVHHYRASSPHPPAISLRNLNGKVKELCRYQVVQNSHRSISFAFDSSNQIVRITCSGDL